MPFQDRGARSLGCHVMTRHCRVTDRGVFVYFAARKMCITTTNLEARLTLTPTSRVSRIVTRSGMQNFKRRSTLCSSHHIFSPPPENVALPHLGDKLARVGRVWRGRDPLGLCGSSSCVLRLGDPLSSLLSGLLKSPAESATRLRRGCAPSSRVYQQQARAGRCKLFRMLIMAWETFDHNKTRQQYSALLTALLGRKREPKGATECRTWRVVSACKSRNMS